MIGVSKVQKANALRLARRQMFLYATSILGYPRNGLKLRVAIQAFCDRYGLKLVGKRNDWLTNLYLSGENEFIGKGKRTVVLKKKYKEKEVSSDVSHLLNKPYKDFLKSAYWKGVRLIVLKRDKNTCTSCGNKKMLQVHHLTYVNHFKEHLNLQDLITLCVDCHKKVHNIK